MLRHICQAVKRKISPHAQKFLKLHKDAYKKALDAKSSDLPSRAVVTLLENIDQEL